jgi:hypothetical protein
VCYNQAKAINGMVMDNIDDLPKNIIKAEMSRKGLKVKDMIELLKPYGEDLSELSFNNKMARKGFSAVFFIKCMKALGVKQVKIED